jgi:hypothetical protein
MRSALAVVALAAITLPIAMPSYAQTVAPAPVAPITDAPPPSVPPPAAPPPPLAPPPPRPPPRIVDITTLERLRDEGVLTQGEYELALRDLGASIGDRNAAEANSLVVGKWATTLYGFLEGDSIYDSTQSFTDAAGNAQVLRPSGSTAPLAPSISGLPTGTVQPVQPTQGYLGSHGQMLFSVRNSRLGLRLRPPGTDAVHTSALLEMDFLGNQPSGVSQTSYFTSPTMRLRHAMFRVETPVVDVMVGQYWHLFGWMEGYLPNTTEIQGLPGQLYARAPQVRVSKTLRSNAVTFDVALAAVRPPALSEVPEGEAGVRLAINKWLGMHTAGATGTSLLPASIAVTGDVRHFEIPEAASIMPTSMVDATSYAVAADLFLPILPARPEKHDNALSLMGQFVSGSGISDLYSGMSSGVMFPFVPNLTQSPAWPTNVDQGLVTYDINPGSFALHPIQWTSFLAGLEYYLPGLGGRVWISGNVSHIQSNNTSQFARDDAAPPNPDVYFYPSSQAQVRKGEDWWDANLFFDPVTSVRVGLEFAEFLDHYVDGFTATNYRAQASGFFIF